MRVPLQQKVAIGYIIATLVLVSITIVEFRYIRGLQKDAEAIDYTHQVKEHLNYVISLVKDMETGVRGYIITDQEEFLEPYESAKQALPGEIETLEKLIGDSDKGTQGMQALKELIERKVNHVNEAVRLQRENHNAEAVALIQTGEGKKAMDEIR